ncbi:predicted protein [Naegleria gruberi]|uniref:Predicted protein n=1 Tax=Naegleria gruberi TaxID=5762 RepID=D2W470_NAEGR|nr:uncharacterized protein NAEGRDRAFT_76200 [Naegleria gruberi]EFC36122.1 predicted protein [Naegleria gruberi]|eukprot:XP_002668866.1 predicted protein [Naegleria gruberi strain NEG-M]
MDARAAACLSDDEDEFQTFTTSRPTEEEYNQLNITGISEDLLMNNNVIFDTSNLDKYNEDEENMYTARSHMTQATPRTSRLYEKKIVPQQGVPLRDPIEHHQIISRASDCIKHLKTALNSPINTSSTQEESKNALSSLRMMDELDYSSQYEIYQSPYEQKLSKVSQLKAKLTEKASPRYMEPKKQITPPKETFSPQLNSKSAKSSPRYLDFMKSPKQEKTARQIVQEKKDLELSRRMPYVKTSPSKTITSPRNITSPKSRSNSFKSDPPHIPALPNKNSTGKKTTLVKKLKGDNLLQVSDINESFEEENLLDESIEESALYDNDDDNEFSNIETTLNELDHIDEIGLESPPDTLFITSDNLEQLIEERNKQEENDPPTDVDIVDQSQSPESSENDEFHISIDEDAVFNNENVEEAPEHADEITIGNDEKQIEKLDDISSETQVEESELQETPIEVSDLSTTSNVGDSMETEIAGHFTTSNVEEIQETPVKLSEHCTETIESESASIIPEDVSQVEAKSEGGIENSPSKVDTEFETSDKVLVDEVSSAENFQTEEPIIGTIQEKPQKPKKKNNKNKKNKNKNKKK